MPIFATAGAKIYIGGTLNPPTTEALEAIDFSTITWTQIGHVNNLGSFGDAAEAIENDDISLARRQKLKGLRDAGTIELVCAIDYADAGQIALLAAEATDHNYAVRVVFDDAPPAGTPSERMFVALVMSAREVLDEANSIMRLQVSLAINSNIVRVAAEA